MLQSNSNILNKHAPLKSKLLRPKPSNPWFTPALQTLKSTRRHLEKIWSRTHSTFDLKLLKSATNHYHTSIIKAKKLYNSTLLSSNLTNPKNSGTPSTNYYIELPNLHFLHLSIWIPYLSHLQHFSQTKFTNFDLQFYLAPPLPHRICLQLPNLLSYLFSILQPLLKSLHSYQVLLTLRVILIQSLPLSSNNANLFFFPQSQISSTYLCPLESFLINSKTVLYIHFSKNPTLTKKTYPITGQYLTYLTYPNSQNDLLKTDLLTISMKTTS